MVTKVKSKKTDDEEKPIREPRPVRVISNEDKIPNEVLDAENNRCNGWNGNEEECKENNCWFYRNSKKCVAHKLKLAEKLKGKSTSKRNRYKKTSRRRKTRKSSKSSKSSRKRKSRRR